MGTKKQLHEVDDYEIQVRHMRMGLVFLVWSLVCAAFFLGGSFTSERVANGSSTLFNVGLFVAALWAYRRIIGYRSNWLLLVTMLAIWGLGDLLWLIIDEMGIDPKTLPWLESVYTLANIAMFFSVLLYLIKNYKKWHTIQLFLDITVILVIITVILLRLYFPLSDLKNILSHDFWTVSVLTLTNMGTVLLLIAIMASGREGRVLYSLVYFLVGILLYTATDMLYLYYYIKDLYEANSLIDAFYMASLFLIATSIVGTVIYPHRYIHLHKFIPHDVGTSSIVWFFLIVPVLLTIFKLLLPIDLILCIVAALIYYFASHYLQKSRMVEALLEKERLLTMQLEGMVEDRTRQLIEANRILDAKAKTDSLTGLINRDFFMLQIHDAIAAESSNRNQFSIIHIDIDRFKIVNDIHGQNMGDQTLLAISHVIYNNILLTYSEDDFLLARIGGDEFGVLLRNSRSEDLQSLSQGLINAMKSPVAIGSFRFYFSITIGIARFPHDGKTAENLVKSADIALNHAKNNHYMAKVALYTDDFISAIIRRNRIEHLLFNANFSTDFQLFYQPQFCLHTGRLIGMEALIRWYHQEEGFISPAEFIPTAEAIGMIPDLSTWIFETAMTQMRDWLSRYPHYLNETNGTSTLRMGINVSALLFDSVDFLPQMVRHCKSLEVSPSWFDLEITETGALNANKHVEMLFQRLSGMGFTISIDDFGTGYSALSYLKRFSVHTLKIAKELCDTIATVPQDQLIVQAITMMSKGMSLNTIAEGVETQEQYEILKEIGCDAIQGYFLGKPCNADQFESNYLK